MLEKLKEINRQKIEEYANDPEKLELQLAIKDVLDVEFAFLVLGMESSYALLRDLDIPEYELNDVYCELIEPKKTNMEDDMDY